MSRVGFVSVAVLSLALAAGAAPGVTWAAETPVPIADLVQPPSLRGAQLSPSGARLALIETRDGRDAVVVIDVAAGTRASILTARPGAVFGWLRWKGEDRLIAGAQATSPRGGEPAGEAVFSVGREGGEALVLSGEGARPGDPDGVRLSDPMAADPRHVLIVAPGQKGRPSLWRVDVHSGAAEFVRDGEGDEDGLPGAAMVVRYRYGPPEDAGMIALGPAEGRDRVYAAVAPRGPADGDTVTVRIFDFRTGAMSKPVWPALRYDVQDIVYRAGGQALAGVCYTAETYVCDFKDAALQADYARIRAELGGELSVAPLSMSDDGQAWLLGVTGAREPGAYYLFDRRSKALRRVANRFPAIEAGQLGPMAPFVYTARDGARIPGYLTLPPQGAEGSAAGPLPLVVMPHGGPEVRDALGFDRWAQALATRGYLVFQPNFRGSSGYGRAWTEAGYREWGGRMQDDLTDGVAALVASGQADPKRICIAGASYGGYAALYGGATQPELYRCVVAVAGVSDLAALVEHERRTNGPRSGEYQYARAVIGDPDRERDKLLRTSPLTYAAAYKPPVLMLHGERDRSVPLSQSRAMADALAAAGRDVRLVVMPGEGHADWSPAHEAEALTAVTEFLKANLGG